MELLYYKLVASNYPELYIMRDTGPEKMVAKVEWQGDRESTIAMASSIADSYNDSQGIKTFGVRINMLFKSGWLAARMHGHEFGKIDSVHDSRGVTLSCKCLRCDRQMIIRSRPARDEFHIEDEAVALECR